MKYTYSILGATGHIGSALSQLLLDQNKSVLMIGHTEEKKKEWTAKGAGFEAVDVLDSETLHKLFGKTERLFIINPPADPAGDAEHTELEHIKSISRALAGLDPQKIVLASTYGARDGENIFDLGILYQLEQNLKANGSPLAIIRSAYYMSNFDQSVKMAMESGILTTILPAEFKLPMVAPRDIAQFAGHLLESEEVGTFYLQAKAEYSASDAAAILSDLLQKDITTNEIPEQQWADYMEKNGFSSRSAKSFVGMTKLTVTEKFEVNDPNFMPTTLSDYFYGLKDQ
jgi:uncharacterized protein YbjT (DUF2867 family)